MLLLGYGGVGRAIEERLAPFEVELTRVASRARDDEAGRIHGIDELPQLLPAAEIVIVGVPLNEATTGLVDDEFLAALPDGALVVNIARGTRRRHRRHPRRGDLAADSASRSTSPIPSRCPTGIRSSRFRTC